MGNVYINTIEYDKNIAPGNPILFKINSQYVNNRHANKQLIKSENWSLY